MTMSRTATIRTEHDDPELVARALRPDNTDEMETTVDAESGEVVTRIERETTSGLHATVDDYVVNLDVATEISSIASTPSGHGSVSDADTTTTTDTNE